MAATVDYLFGYSATTDLSRTAITGKLRRHYY